MSGSSVSPVQQFDIVKGLRFFEGSLNAYDTLLQDRHIIGENSNKQA